MSTQWGATALPLAAPSAGEAVTDRALSTIGAYLQAFVNEHGATAWQAVHKDSGLTVADNLPVRNVYTYNPEDARREFNDRTFPALFLWRESGDDDWLGADWRVDNAVWRALWIFPPAKQQHQPSRDPFLSGLVKLVSYALKRGRDASYQDAADTDATALTVAALPTAIKTSIATSAAPQTYSGAALNGSIGTGSISPPRPPTVTTSGTLGSLVAGSDVVFTGLNSIGMTITSTVTIGAALGTFTGDYDLSSVTSVAATAQAGTAAAWTFGLGEFTGKGTVALRRAGLVSLTLTNYRTRLLPIQYTDGSTEKALQYDAIEMSFAAVERLEEDITDTGNALNQVDALEGVTQSFLREDETEIESAHYDA